jgi:hypothetical protein
VNTQQPGVTYANERFFVDTLAAVRRLEVGGFSAEQADTIVRLWAELLVGRLVTNADLSTVQAEIKSDLSHFATKADLADLKAELKENVVNLRFELKEDIASLKLAIADLKTELKADISILRTDMGKLETSLRADIANLRAEFKQDNSGLRADVVSLKKLVMWLFGIFGAVTATATSGALVAFLRH